MVDFISALHTMVFITLVGTAAVTDVRERRIPNELVVTGFVVALLLRASIGVDVHVAGLKGAGLAFLIVLPLFMLHAIGGGDAKLVIMVGAFMGPERLVPAMMVAAVAGGAMALGAMVRQRAAVRVLRSTAGLVAYGLTMGRMGSRTTLESPGAVTIPLGVAIAIGAVVGWIR
jgi:prepilin peptidase CpaA